jgi:hypothetical protein
VPSKTILGITPVELNLVYVTFGAGKPMSYAETGWSVSACLGHRIKEVDFRPRFLKACQKGLVSFESWGDLEKHRLARTVVALPKCVDMIRDVQIYLGGDYSYYKYFDPYVNYEKNPEKMDRFLKGPLTFESHPRQIGRKKLYEEQWKNHMKDPKKYRWF